MKRAEKRLDGVLSIAAMARYMASCWSVDKDGLSFLEKQCKDWLSGEFIMLFLTKHREA